MIRKTLTILSLIGLLLSVGAWDDDDNGNASGSAYLFDTTTGQQIAKLLPDDGAAGGRFGFSVSISGEIAIVGAFLAGGTSGSAYLFDVATGAQIAQPLPHDGDAGDRFGVSVAISGATAIVGAYRDDDNRNISGSAYLFDAKTGEQVAKLLPDDGAEGDNFGISVAIRGTTAIVGARYDEDNGDDSGSAYLFDASYCPWDFDGDGNVGPYDLAFLLGFWGPNPGHAADLDDDGEVGPFDLALLLGAWGPCP